MSPILPVHDSGDVLQGSGTEQISHQDTPLALIRALSLPVKQWMDIAQHAHILEMLKHRCCVCVSQWIANIRSVKLHVLKVHPEIYKSTGAEALADCKKVGHLVSSCRFCGMKVSKTSEHAGTCPVFGRLGSGLYLLTKLLQHPSMVATGRGEPLRISPPSEATGPHRGAAHHGTKTCQVPSIAAGHSLHCQPSGQHCT